MFREQLEISTEDRLQQIRAKSGNLLAEMEADQQDMEAKLLRIAELEETVQEQEQAFNSLASNIAALESEKGELIRKLAEFEAEIQRYILTTDTT